MKSTKLIAGPFTRMFVSRAEEARLIETLTQLYNGRVLMQFDHEPTASTVYAIRTSIGQFSLVATDKAQADLVADTKLTLVVESVDDALDAARAAGLEITLDKTPVPVGFQSHLRISAGNQLEFTEWSPEMLAKMRAQGLID